MGAVATYVSLLSLSVVLIFLMKRETMERTAYFSLYFFIPSALIQVCSNANPNSNHSVSSFKLADAAYRSSCLILFLRTVNFEMKCFTTAPQHSHCSMNIVSVS